MILNWAGALWTGVVLSQWVTIRDLEFSGQVPQGVPSMEQRFLILVGTCFFVLQEVDRVIGNCRTKEANQLSCGFEGTIADATCSEAADRSRIFQEIGDKIAGVDYAIHVLLAAGMSTPTLREIARAGVDIRDAGHAEIAAPIVAFALTSSVVVADLFYGLCCQHILWHFSLFQSISLLARFAVLIILWYSPRDERCFILKMTSKLLIAYLVLVAPLVVFWQLRAVETGTPRPLARSWSVAPMAAYTSIFAFSCAWESRVVFLFLPFLWF